MAAADVLENVAYARAHNTEQQEKLLMSAASMMTQSRFGLIVVDRCVCYIIHGGALKFLHHWDISYGCLDSE